MSLANPVRNQKLPIAIQMRLNEMYARATGFSGPEILEFFSQYSLDIEQYPWQGGAPSRHQILEDCLARFDVDQQKQLVGALLVYDGRLKYGQPTQEDRDFIRAWLDTGCGSIAALPLQQMTVAAQPTPAKDVFLCHASSDKDSHVRPLAQELTARRVSFWLDEAEIGWGASVTNTINQGLGTSRYVLVFISEAFLQRNWPQTELSNALHREVSSGSVVVLPLMIADPEIVFKKYALLRDKSYEEWSRGPAHIAERLHRLLE